MQLFFFKTALAQYYSLVTRAFLSFTICPLRKLPRIPKNLLMSSLHTINKKSSVQAGVFELYEKVWLSASLLENHNCTGTNSVLQKEYPTEFSPCNSFIKDCLCQSNLISRHTREYPSGTSF